MNTSIIIPYRSSSADRDRIFDKVRYRWKVLLPSAEIILGQDDDEPFSRSKARNNGAAQANGDVLVFADADTICNSGYILTALKLAQEYPWSFPYKVYYNLTREHTEKVIIDISRAAHSDINRPSLSECEFAIPSVGGIFCMKASRFREIGGYDESFVGWGYEDDAFRITADTMLGMHVSVPGGWVAHLWHDSSEENRFQQPNISRNLRRLRRYEAASGKRESMLKLIGKSK